MGSDMSKAIGPEIKSDPAVRTALNDEKVLRPKYGTATFSQKTIPQVDARWGRMVIPDEYCETNGPDVYYRIPGVAFGREVARCNDRVMIRCTWPRKSWVVCAPLEQMEQVMESQCVSTVRVPQGLTGSNPYASLPKKTQVTMEDGGTHELINLPPGLQQHINQCHK